VATALIVIVYVVLALSIAMTDFATR